MQLKYIGKARPIILTAGLIISGTTFPFLYNEDDSNREESIPIIQNIDASNYINELAYNSFEDNLLSKIRFYEYFNKWEKKTKFYSFAKQIISDENFQSIINMQESAVPFIIEELEKKPSFLVWALNIIYNKKISNNPNLTIESASKLWIKELKA